MSKFNKNSFVFSHTVNLPVNAAARVWEIWSDLANWQFWDVSLKGTEAIENGLYLGKRFTIIPKNGPGPFEVGITSLIEGVHFTTTSESPIGLLSFGHTLMFSEDRQKISLQHSICNLSSNVCSVFPPHLQALIQEEMIMSVNTLSNIVLNEG